MKFSASAPALLATAALCLGAATPSIADAAQHSRSRHHKHVAHSVRHSSAATVSCNLYASPSGSDTTGNGGLANPYATLVKLDSSLAPGQTGCLEAGSYGSTTTWHELSNSGTSSDQITISAAPGARVTVVGYVDLEAAYTTLENLNIDGSNSLYASHPAGVNCPDNTSDPLVIAGNNDILQYDNYYQSVASMRGVGIGVGFWGNADNTIIRYDKIHDVGQCGNYDHLIYLSHGNNVQIYDNWMWNDSHGQAVLLYPDPTNARVDDNVIANSSLGIGFGDDGTCLSGNQVWNNVVANSTRLKGDGWSIQGVLAQAPSLGSCSTGNKVFHNDSFHNPGGLSSVSSAITSTQLSLTGNMTSNPKFVDAAAHDYAVGSGSPLASWGLWNGS